MTLREKLACLSAGWADDLESLNAMHPEDIEIAYDCADDQLALFRKEVEGLVMTCKPNTLETQEIFEALIVGYEACRQDALELL